MRYVRLAVMVFTWLAIVPAAAYAQASITGVVRDTSGGVLPGVTVEATSPALIEQVRSAVTDGTGQYRIEALRPGVYTVTFTLPGFAIVRREGIELAGTFVATVNAELRVGALEETVTVTGESPIVDVQSTTRQAVLDQEVIDALPSARNPALMAGLLPAVMTGNRDVGGLEGESFATSGGVEAHGVDEPRTQVNGVSVHSAQGSGATGVGNAAAYQEVVVDMGGISVEQREGGVRMNMVPREGGNTFSGVFYGSYANRSWQGDNFTQELQDRGLAAPDELKKFWDLNPALGGPIVRDKLWFHGAYRNNGAFRFVPQFINKNAGNPNVWTFDPDTIGPRAAHETTWKGGNGRVTWQVSPRNKLGVAYDFVHSCQCPRPDPRRTLEAAEGRRAQLIPKDMAFIEWTAPVTSRLLLEANVLRHSEHAFRPTENAFFLQDPGPVKLNGVQEQTTRLRYRASSGASTNTWNRTFLTRFALSYITGAHAVKVGFNTGNNSQNQGRFAIDSPMEFRFRNGVPNRLTLQATPFSNKSKSTDFALFAQDRWTQNRLTVTAGLRYDYFRSFFPDVTVGPGEFVPNRNIVFGESDGVSWNDLQPRLGLAYDVFGDGRTALKANLGKYLKFMGLSNRGEAFTTALAPTSLLVTRTNRSWRDRDRDFVPDCDLIDPAANGECGRMSNPDFGSSRPGVTYDPDSLDGWGNREFNWQFSAGVQHEIVPRVSVDVSYFRTWYGNFIFTDNRAVDAADYDEFSITAPLDPRLPGGGGYVVPGLFDLTEDAFGRPADGFLTFSDNFGKQTQHWNGVDVTVNARPRPDLLFQGGTSTGRSTTDICDMGAAAGPEALFERPGGQGPVLLTDEVEDWLPAQWCKIQENWLTQAKLIGSYTVPQIDLQLTGTFRSLPGPLILAQHTLSSAEVAQLLGRRLSGRKRNITVNIVEPGTLYGERHNQFDLRIAKILNVGGTRTTASLDLYNLFNSSAVLEQSNSFDIWQRPEGVPQPRWVKVVVQFDF